MAIVEKKVNLYFLVVERLPYDVNIGDPSMEELKVVLDLGNRVASLVIDGKVVQLSPDPDYMHLLANVKDGTESEDFTSSTSKVPSSESSSRVDDNGEDVEVDEEFILRINDDSPNESNIIRSN